MTTYKIRSFDEGRDVIVVTDWKAIADFADVRSHAHNQGNSVVIEAGDDSLTIVGMHKSDLQAGDSNWAV